MSVFKELKREINNYGIGLWNTDLRLWGDCFVWGPYLAPELLLRHYFSRYSGNHLVPGTKPGPPVSKASIPMAVSPRPMDGILWYVRVSWTICQCFYGSLSVLPLLISPAPGGVRSFALGPEQSPQQVWLTIPYKKYVVKNSCYWVKEIKT